MAVGLVAGGHAGLSHVLAAVFYAVSVIFVYRSFYSMRIQSQRDLGD